jgi:iron complex transport system permease protein
MALSSAGLLMQGVFRNPLVSPYTLGISNGAAFGASLAIVFRAKFLTLMPVLGHYTLPVSAFVFSCFAMGLVYLISRIKGHDSRTLILSGVAIGYLFSALVSSMRYFSNIRELPELIFWTMGALSGIPWNGIALIALVDLAGIILMMRYAWDLNALASGEESAMSLGVNHKRIRIIAFVLSTLMTAVTVAFTGVIGFVGLIAPHISRMLVGSDYRYAIPASALMGALLLLVSDTLARTIIAPTELPVGVITSFVGVPFFLYLIMRRRG